MARNKILFYYQDEREINEAYRIFSNFYASPITVDIPSELDKNGRPTSTSANLGEFDFPTAEHLFQVLKFSQNASRARGIATSLLRDRDPQIMKDNARSREGSVRKD